MNVTIRKMETDDEIRGKAFVHWKSWHESYAGLVDPAYLAALTLEKCEKLAFQWPDNLLVAKDGERVIGFVGFGESREIPDCGEIFALYVLEEYQRKGIGSRLMEAGMRQLSVYPKKSLWVLAENRKAIRFYRKYGFRPDGSAARSDALSADVIRMILD
ncbi:MAG: GNAT family N-acetyltransferase [Lachnospiraceae bacterium]|nr:GNAT family N-acetyltransferase [Lachnospiraceae bacterium]